MVSDAVQRLRDENPWGISPENIHLMYPEEEEKEIDDLERLRIQGLMRSPMARYVEEAALEEERLAVIAAAYNFEYGVEERGDYNYLLDIAELDPDYEYEESDYGYSTDEDVEESTAATSVYEHDVEVELAASDDEGDSLGDLFGGSEVVAVEDEEQFVREIPRMVGGIGADVIASEWSEYNAVQELHGGFFVSVGLRETMCAGGEIAKDVVVYPQRSIYPPVCKSVSACAGLVVKPAVLACATMAALVRPVDAGVVNVELSVGGVTAVAAAVACAVTIPWYVLVKYFPGVLGLVPRGDIESGMSENTPLLRDSVFRGATKCPRAVIQCSGIGITGMWGGIELRALAMYGGEVISLQVAVSAAASGKNTIETNERVTNGCSNENLAHAVIRYVPEMGERERYVGSALEFGPEVMSSRELTTALRAAVALTKDSTRLTCVDTYARILHVTFPYELPAYDDTCGSQYAYASMALEATDVVSWFKKKHPSVPIKLVLGALVPERVADTPVGNLRGTAHILGGAYFRVLCMRALLRGGVITADELQSGRAGMLEAVRGGGGFRCSQLAGVLDDYGLPASEKLVYRLLGLLVLYRHNELRARMFGVAVELLEMLSSWRAPVVEVAGLQTVIL